VRCYTGTAITIVRMSVLTLVDCVEMNMHIFIFSQLSCHIILATHTFLMGTTNEWGMKKCAFQPNLAMSRKILCRYIDTSYYVRQIGNHTISNEMMYLTCSKKLIGSQISLHTILYPAFQMVPFLMALGDL